MGYSSSALSQYQKKSATYADLEALPPHVVGELIDGELIVSPRPASLHALAATRLGTEIAGRFDRGRGGPGGWIILYEPELHFREQVLVPDLAGWRRERMPEMPDVAAFELTPDWVCEVLSPSTVTIDRARKMRPFAAAKVGHVWLVDPVATTLESSRQRRLALGFDVRWRRHDSCRTVRGCRTRARQSVESVDVLDR